MTAILGGCSPSRQIPDILHPLYEQRYVIAYVGSLTEQSAPRTCLNYLSAYEHQNYIKIGYNNSVNDVTVYVIN
jgi:hypothetical protein